MALLIADGEEIEIKNGESIMNACEELGHVFGCRAGVCGVCEIEVVSGMENLNPLTDEEKEMGMMDDHRLACQCTILQGTVEIILNP